MANRNLIWFILGTILLLALYSITFGKVDFVNKEKLSEEEKRQKAKKEHARLIKEIENKRYNKNKIISTRKWLFFVVRFLMLTVWGLTSAYLYKCNITADLNELVLYNEIFIIIIAALIYLIAGNLNNLKEISEYVKKKIENRLYKKRLELIESEITDLENKKEKVELNLKK